MTIYRARICRFRMSGHGRTTGVLIIESLEVTMSFPTWARVPLIAAAMSLAACSDGNRAAMTTADTDVRPRPFAAEARPNQARAIPVAMRELPDFTALV